MANTLMANVDGRQVDGTWVDGRQVDGTWVDGRQVDGTRVDDTRRYCTQNFDENALIFVQGGKGAGAQASVTRPSCVEVFCSMHLVLE